QEEGQARSQFDVSNGVDRARRRPLRHLLNLVQEARTHEQARQGVLDAPLETAQGFTHGGELHQFTYFGRVGCHRPAPATGGQVREDFTRAGGRFTGRLRVTAENRATARRVARPADLEGPVDAEAARTAAGVVVVEIVVHAGAAAHFLHRNGHRMFAGSDRDLEVGG